MADAKRSKWCEPREYIINFTGNQWKAYTINDRAKLDALYAAHVASLSAKA